MLQLRSCQLQQLETSYRASDREAANQLSALRSTYPDLLGAMSDARLLAELREALERCDELGLIDADDRRMFCQWDQIICPGMRALKQWPHWIAHCRQTMAPPQTSVLTRMLVESPPSWWERQLAEHREARRARGLPDLQAGAQAGAGALGARRT